MNKDLENAMRYLFMTVQYGKMPLVLIDWARNASTATLRFVVDVANPFYPYVALPSEYQDFILEELFTRED